MKKFIRLMFISALALSFCSCTDFLDRPTEDNYNVSNFYKTDAQLEQGVNYLYNSPWYDFQRAFIKIGEVMSGNMYMGSSPYLDFSTNGTDVDLINMSYSLWAVNGHANTVKIVSTDPQRDSLEWNSVQPTYYYNVAELTANGVFMVNTADAAVAPGGDTLHIRQGGAMNLINKAQILASRDNKYHLIYDADVMVNGRYKYTGKGYIDYVDENEKKQKIFLSEIKSNSAQTTVGEGFITDSANFTLNEALGDTFEVIGGTMIVAVELRVKS